jgi:hypothetical protein
MLDAKRYARFSWSVHRMTRVLLHGLIALFFPVFSAAEDVPDLGAVGRAVYLKYDPATTRTGERGTACNLEAQLLARPVAVKRWKGLGREQFVAAFSLWVEDPETNQPLEFAQACGRSPCDVALLERVGNDLRLVARGRVNAGCTALDLAPYRILPGETLIGARGYWMNHGFGDTTLVLLRVEGTALRAVLSVPVERSIPELEEKGVVTMVPQPDRPANVRIRFERKNDDGKMLPSRTEEYRWNGTNYLPVVPSAR